MKKFEGFKIKIDRKLNVVDAKLSYMNEGLKGLSKEFRSEMDDFIDFVAESYPGYKSNNNR